MEINNARYWDAEEEAVGSGFAIHPGLIIKNSILPSRNMSVGGLAEAIGVARPGLSKVLNGKRDLTGEMAALIGAALLYPDDVLATMMANHALARAKSALVDRIAAIADVAQDHLDKLIEAANENNKVREAM
ncbi:helix-turn-helix domain-containing protein [Sphingomonas sp. CFBP 8760]|nr:helix-turn-helix domain-containing protein [Sphingomonas sp. CFBP 8760]